MTVCESFKSINGEIQVSHGVVKISFRLRKNSRLCQLFFVVFLNYRGGSVAEGISMVQGVFKISFKLENKSRHSRLLFVVFINNNGGISGRSIPQ